MNIKFKLIFAFLALSLPFLAATNLFFHFSEEKARTWQILNHLESVASIQQHRIHDIEEQNKERLRLVASRTQLRLSLREFLAGNNGREQSRMNRILADAKASLPAFRNIFICSDDGIIVASTDLSVIGSKYPYEDFLAKGREGLRSDLVYLDPDQYLSLVLAGPLYLENDFLGVLLIDAEVESIVSSIADYAGLGQTGETVLAARNTNGDTVFIMPTRFDEQAALRLSIPQNNLNMPINRAFSGKSELFVDAVDYRGVPVLAATRYITDVNWGLVVKIDREEAFASLMSKQKIFIAILAGAVVLITFLSFSLAKNITGPIIRLTGAAKKIAEGNFEEVAVEASKDEIGLLAGAFNKMTGNLISAQKKLETKVDELNSEIIERKRAESALRLDEERLESLLKLSGYKWESQEELTDFALEEAVRLTNSEGGYLHFINEDQASIGLYSWSREVLKTCKAEKDSHYPLERAGIWADCVRQGKPVVHNDYQTVDERKGYPEGHFQVNRHMSIPIFDKEKIVAVVGVGNKKEKYDESDVRQATLFMTNMWQLLKKKMAEEEKEKIEARLRQSYKMEAIGTLAGGIAHDFNNILAIIMGNADMAIHSLPEGHSVRRYVEQALIASDRAKELVKQILAFSRKGELELMPVKPHLLIKEILKLLRSTVPSTISIIKNIDESCGAIMGDPTQIHQLFLNLFSNAVHAMDEKGEIRVGLEEVDLNDSDLKGKKNLEPGRYVRLSVADSGAGMDQKTLDRAFDPFFTTKGVGEGTGMGLSVVHGIVESHGGAIEVDSESGKGTCFRVYFPVVKNEPFSQMKSFTPLPSGTESILFVDDEEMIADLCGRQLELQGYSVTIETDCVAALNTIKSNPKKFDLVITDQAMPNMSGTELAAEILKIRHDLPVVLCTGYSKKISEEKALAMGIKAFCMKPMSRKSLAEVVRKVLDEGKA